MRPQFKNRLGFVVALARPGFKTERAVGAVKGGGIVAQLGEDDEEALFDPAPGQSVLDRMDVRFAAEGAFDHGEESRWHNARTIAAGGGCLKEIVLAAEHAAKIGGEKDGVEREEDEDRAERVAA